MLFDRALPAARARRERRRIGAAAVFTFLVVIAAAFAWRLSNDITAPPPTQAQLPAIDRAQFPGSSSAASSQALSSRPATAAQVPETAEAPPPSTSSPLVGSAPGREPIEEHSTAKEQSTRKEQGIPKDQGIPVILVLPFRDLSGSPIASDLGKGIAEEFISSLATFPDFDVISSTTSLAYAGKTVPEIVKTTAAQFIIEGSIRLTGEKAFITAQLINGTTDRHLQIAQIEEPRTDPVTLQMAAAGRLRDALGGITGIVRQEYERIAWNKPDAELTEYDFYIRGHTYFLRRDRYSARDIWQEGVRRFPSSVLLLCRLSTTYNNYAPETAKLVAQSAKMQRKTRLDDWHYHWAAARAEFGRGDFQKAIAEAKATIAIAPYDAISHADLSWILSEAGAHEIAIDWINFAVLHDPNPRRWYFTNLATIYEYAGKWPEVAILAEEQLRQPRASKYWYEVLARAYNATRQEDKAAQAWSKFYSLPDPAQD